MTLYDRYEHIPKYAPVHIKDGNVVCDGRSFRASDISDIKVTINHVETNEPLVVDGETFTKDFSHRGYNRFKYKCKSSGNDAECWSHEPRYKKVIKYIEDQERLDYRFTFILSIFNKHSEDHMSYSYTKKYSMSYKDLINGQDDIVVEQIHKWNDMLLNYNKIKSKKLTLKDVV